MCGTARAAHHRHQALHSRSAVAMRALRRQNASKALDSVICWVAPSLSFQAVTDTKLTPLLKSVIGSYGKRVRDPEVKQEGAAIE